MADARRELIEDLHGCYDAGSLRILVGAGVSMASGLPGWDALNLGLLRAVIETDLRGRCENAEGAAYVRSLVGPDAIANLTDEVYKRIGRDAAADFAWRRLGDTDFKRHLARHLYPRPIEQLPLRSTQRQLAAMAHQVSDRDLLFTTNYDPILERAIAELRGAPGEWSKHRFPLSARSRSNARPRVHHLHGWLDERGTVGGTLVLTETSYLGLFADKRAKPNTDLNKLLMGNAPVLVLGMSLADPNLRRLLDRRRMTPLREGDNAIYAVMVGGNEAADDQINQYWTGTWNVNPLWLPNFGYIPHLLRQIQWGWTGDSLPWFDTSRAWVDQHLGALRFTDAWQRRANRSLKTLVEHVRTYFGLAPGEVITTSLFLPELDEGRQALQLVATSRHVRTGDEARAHAKRRALKLAPERTVQGVAGISFHYGNSNDACDNHPSINYNFSSKQVREWDRLYNMRDWRSILAVPAIDSEAWLPYATITLTSNLAKPFWRRFGNERNDLPVLKTLMRRVCKELVVHHGLTP
ncbi:MAG: SIR2 family protein [Myxococcota bacterium]